MKPIQQHVAQTLVGTPPNSAAAEQIVLAGIMQQGRNMLDECKRHVVIEDFYHTTHQVIFTALLELDEKNLGFNPIEVWEHCDITGKRGVTLNDITTIFRECVGTHAAQYAKAVRNLSYRRRLLQAGAQIMQLSRSRDDTDALPERAHTMIDACDQDENDVEIGTTAMIQETVNHMEGLHNGVLQPLATGFAGCDKTLTMMPGNLVVLAGRPGMGKSTFALNVALHNAQLGKHVVVLSLEMSRLAVSQLLCAQISTIDRDCFIDRERIDDDVWRRLSHAMHILKDLPLTILEGNDTVEGISATVRRLHRKKPVDLLVIDYLGYILVTPRTGERKTDQIAHQTWYLRQRLARELKCPILLLCQMNRAIDTTDRLPVLGDLRDSGAIEQDADIVAFLHRDLKNENAPTVLVVRKNRHGRIGHSLLDHEQLCYGRFLDADNPYDPYQEHT